MYVKDLHGNWYEISDKTIKDKKVNPDKAREIVAAERAEKRKKVLKILSSLDQDERRILCDKILLHAPGRLFPQRLPEGPGGHAACDCVGMPESGKV